MQKVSTALQVCLDNSDWLGVAKVSELERIPSYGDVIQLTARVSSPENCPSYSRFRVIKIRVIETNLYMQKSIFFINVMAISADAAADRLHDVQTHAAPGLTIRKMRKEVPIIHDQMDIYDCVHTYQVVFIELTTPVNTSRHIRAICRKAVRQ